MTTKVMPNDEMMDKDMAFIESSPSDIIINLMVSINFLMFALALVGLGLAVYFSSMLAIYFTAFVIVDLATIGLGLGLEQSNFERNFPLPLPVLGVLASIIGNMLFESSNEGTLLSGLGYLALLYTSYLSVFALAALLLSYYPVVAVGVASSALLIYFAYIYFVYQPVKSFVMGEKDDESTVKPANSGDFSASPKSELSADARKNQEDIEGREPFIMPTV